MEGFRDLNVWRRAKELAVEIYRLTREAPFSSDFALRDQIRRAAVSIPGNIAEADERGSNDDKCSAVGKMLGGLIKARSSHNP